MYFYVTARTAKPKPPELNLVLTSDNGGYAGPMPSTGLCRVLLIGVCAATEVRLVPAVTLK